LPLAVYTSCVTRIAPNWIGGTLVSGRIDIGKLSTLDGPSANVFAALGAARATTIAATAGKNFNIEHTSVLKGKSAREQGKNRDLLYVGCSPFPRASVLREITRSRAFA
jgi:hypothetical protein